MTIIVTGGAGFIGANFIYLALNDKPLPVYGKGKNVRDWLCKSRS